MWHRDEREHFLSHKLNKVFGVRRKTVVAEFVLWLPPLLAAR